METGILITKAWFTARPENKKEAQIKTKSCSCSKSTPAKNFAELVKLVKQAEEILIIWKLGKLVIFLRKKYMIQVNIKEIDKQVFAKERYEHPHTRVNQRMDALHLKSKGLSNKEICNILGICNNALLSYFKMYNEGGIEKLRETNFNRPKSEMEKHLNTIKEYFIQNPPHSISEAAAKIKELTGIERHKTQVRKFMKHLGFRCLAVGVVPAKALTEEKKTSRKNIWTTNCYQD